MKKITSLLLLGIGMAGIVDSLLVWRIMRLGSAECSVFTGCNEVLFSSYNTLFGISLFWWGLAFYGALTIMAVLLMAFSARWIRGVLSLLVGGGFLFSLYLVYVQTIVLGSLCSYCMGSFVLMIIAGYLVFVFRGLDDNR